MKVAVVVPVDLSQAGGVETHILQLNLALRELGVEANIFGYGAAQQVKPLSEFQPKEYAIVHTHGSSFSSELLNILLQRRFGQRHVHTLHGVSIDYLLACRAWRNWRCYTGSLVEGFFSRCADHVIAVSQSVASRARQCFVLSEKKITVIPNGFRPFIINDDMRRQTRSRFHLNDDHRVLLFVGRSEDPVKGADTITTAMDRLYRNDPNLRLLAVPGTGFKDAAWLIRAGQIAHDQMPHLYTAADLFINASRNEGMPLTVIEAMAAGLPVIAANVGGIGELITHRHNGILLADGCCDLTERIRELCDSESLHRRLAANAPTSVSTLSWRDLARQTVRVYQKIVSSN